MVPSEYQLGEVPPNPVHIHEEAKKPARPVVWEICLHPQILNCMVKGPKKIILSLVFKGNSCGLQ